MDNKDERAELAERFLRDISTDPAGAYFGEEELVELFDYATDIDSLFLRQEVLIFGAEHYPQSDALKVRRAYHYYYEGVAPPQVLFLLGQLEHPGLLAKVLALRMRDMPVEEVRKALDELVAEIDTFEDEEVIQLVDAAGTLGCCDWLRDNTALLKSKCTYLPTLLYELAEVYFENHLYEQSAEALDELTGLEPFNLSFWNRLTEVCGTMEAFERGLQSADFGLAIAPDDPHTRVLKARVLFGLRRNPEEIVDLIGDLPLKYLEESGSPMLAELLASTYSWLLHDNEKAVMVLQQAADMKPDSRELIEAFAHINSDDLADRARRYFSANPVLDQEETARWLQSLLGGEHPCDPEAVRILMKAYYLRHPAAEGFQALVELTYRLELYDEVIELAAMRRRRLTEEELAMRRSPVIVLAEVMAMLRRPGRRDIPEILSFIDRSIAQEAPVRNVDEMISSNGLMLRLELIRDYLTKHRRISRRDLDRLDPFPTSYNTVEANPEEPRLLQTDIERMFNLDNFSTDDPTADETLPF